MRPILPLEHKFQFLLLAEAYPSRPDKPLIRRPFVCTKQKPPTSWRRVACYAVFSESLRLLARSPPW